MKTGERTLQVGPSIYMWNAQHAFLVTDTAAFTVTLHVPEVLAGIEIYTGTSLADALAFANTIR